MLGRLWRAHVAARSALLLGLASFGAFAQNRIDDHGFLAAGARVRLHGVVYSAAPIGAPVGAEPQTAACLYARDLPLIAAAGANAVRTRNRIDPSEDFGRALAANDLYWLADFSLEPYFDASRSLSPKTPSGRELRQRILADFAAYAQSWAHEPRLLALVFGVRTAENYEGKFAGDKADFYALAEEAGRRLDALGLDRILLTTAVASAAEIGGVGPGTDDASLPSLDFWSLELTGRGSVAAQLDLARRRTTKPYVVAGFGVDAFDAATGGEDPDTQRQALEAMAAEIDNAERSALHRLAGSFYDSFVDEWARGGPAAAGLHGTDSRPLAAAPDGAFHPAWTGLFGAVRSGAPGLDSLRARPAYAALAARWGGVPPAELTHGGAPRVAPGGVQHATTGFSNVARGGLVSVRGSELGFSSRQTADPAALPLNLGPVSVCLAGRPVPLYYAGASEIRGQAPWDAPLGEQRATVFRGGAASAPVETTVREAAPGILPRGVFRPGRPCPVDETNGVPAGSYLEVYGTGLGPAAGVPMQSGFAPGDALPTSDPPRARLDGALLETLYSGLYPAAPAVTQTNVRIAPNQPPGPAELRLEAGGLPSNPHRLTIVDGSREPGFQLADPAVRALVVQEGGPAAGVELEILGFDGFCELVRFEVIGLPPGVRATIPVGFPGGRVRFSVRAEAGAPRIENAPVIVRAVAAGLPARERTFRVTVLPGSGDIRFQVISGGWLSGAPTASFRIDDVLLYETNGGGPGRGVNVLTVDPRSGAIGAVRTFDTWASEEEALALERYLLGLADGTLVLAAIADDGTLMLTPDVKATIRETLGSAFIERVEYQWSWAILARKGAGGPIAERMQPNGLAVIDRVLSFPLAPLE